MNETQRNPEVSASEQARLIYPMDLDIKLNFNTLKGAYCMRWKDCGQMNLLKKKVDMLDHQPLFQKMDNTLLIRGIPAPRERRK